MTPSARLSAAIEILSDIEARRRPAPDVLKDWGLSHRFAGSGDRAALASLVYDTLRVRSSAAWIMGDKTPRAVLLGALKLVRGYDVEKIASLCNGDRFAPLPLTEAETAGLTTATLDDAPAHIQGDYPEWLDSSFADAFGEGRVDELKAMTTRASVDIRINTLKSDREKVHGELDYLGVTDTPLSPHGLRLMPKEDGRAPAVQAEPAFQKGWIEIQDEGSQLVAQLVSADPGTQVIDLCAGGGGKTLALAAQMNNLGQIFATDTDKRRLAPIFERLDRAGVRNTQVLAPKGKDDEPLIKLKGKADLVVVDAPCTGTGTWRRNPDAKWRIRPASLDERIAEQRIVLDRAAMFVAPGGRLAYITCSLLNDENDRQIQSFLDRHDSFSVIEPEKVANDAGLPALAGYRSSTGVGLLLTPRRTATDGFFLSILKRAK